jgi:hypothetical protein
MLSKVPTLLLGASRAGAPAVAVPAAGLLTQLRGFAAQGDRVSVPRSMTGLGLEWRGVAAAAALWWCRESPANDQTFMHGGCRTLPTQPACRTTPRRRRRRRRMAR